ncbi:hypothetical protein L1887_05981 [Cichorium endivia]|nr:hypothetical protein L1887_05981 [Cichorium endivia]
MEAMKLLPFKFHLRLNHLLSRKRHVLVQSQSLLAETLGTVTSRGLNPNSFLFTVEDGTSILRLDQKSGFRASITIFRVTPEF